MLDDNGCKIEVVSSYRNSRFWPIAEHMEEGRRKITGRQNLDFIPRAVQPSPLILLFRVYGSHEKGMSVFEFRSAAGDSSHAAATACLSDIFANIRGNFATQDKPYCRKLLS